MQLILVYFPIINIETVKDARAIRWRKILMLSPSFSYERWIWKHKAPFYWWCWWNTENTICTYFWCLWWLFKYGNIEVFQPAQPSSRTPMLFTLTHLLPECKMFSFRERDCAPNACSLAEVRNQPAKRRRNKTCIISWECITLPFGAVVTISSTSGQSPTVQC